MRTLGLAYHHDAKEGHYAKVMNTREGGCLAGTTNPENNLRHGGGIEKRDKRVKFVAPVRSRPAQQALLNDSANSTRRIATFRLAQTRLAHNLRARHSRSRAQGVMMRMNCLTTGHSGLRL